MSKFVVKTLGPIFAGIIFFVSVILTPAYYLGYLDPIPYKNVTIRHVERVEGAVQIIADFVKVGCTREDVVFVGVSLGQTSGPLPVRDLDGRVGRSLDRLAGRHTMRVSVIVGSAQYDEIEVKTRHTCNGQRIDKVFAVIPIPMG